jgi:hypothetical protein
MSDLQLPLFRYLLYTAYFRAIDCCVFMDFNPSDLIYIKNQRDATWQYVYY